MWWFSKKQKLPSGTFKYLGHQIVFDRIDLWVQFPDGTTDLFKIPYDKGFADQFDIAKQAERQGVRTTGEFIGSKLRIGI